MIDDSIVQMGRPVMDDDSNISLSNRKVLGIEDSELTNDQIVGTGHIH